MNDQDEQQPIPEQPIEQPTRELTTNEKKKQNRGILEKLPLEVRQELDEYIRAKNPSAAKKYIVGRHGTNYPMLASVSIVTFYKYAEKHNIKGIDNVLQAQITKTSPELLNAINKLSDVNAPIGDKRAALTALYNDCAATSRKLEATQINFMDSQIQMVILQNRKQMVTIIEKLSVLNDQLSKDSDKNWLEEAEFIVQVCTSAAVNSYKITHAIDESNFSKFMNDYRTRLIDLMRAYRLTKETLKKPI